MIGVRSRLQPVAAAAVLVVAVAGCGWREWGDSGTAATVTNSCDQAIVVRLSRETWDRSAEDQRKGEHVEPGEAAKVGVVNPPDKSEGLVLRISPVEGEPLFVVPVERDSDLKVSISPGACPFALGDREGSCDPVIDGDQELVIVCR